MTRLSPRRLPEDRRDLLASGEIDVDTVAPIEQDGLDALSDPAILTVTLDLRRVTFIDSTGIGTLIRLRLAAEAQNKHFILRAPSEPVLRVLALTSLTTAFEIEPP